MFKTNYWAYKIKKNNIHPYDKVSSPNEKNFESQKNY